MDILEEIDVFLSVCQLTQDESNNLVFNGITGCFESKYLADWFVNQINFGWKLWQAAKAQAVPEWAVIVPRLSANYLFNKVPELGFKHQDEKDTVLYHLNYMASGFKESAKQLVEDNHAKQKAMIEAQEPAND